MLRFDNRVAVVTGAGAGLGRCYALKFAERGAAVVVNDLGGSFSGEGQGSRAADQVVEEIRSKGGKATPSYDSVENGEKIIKTAIDTYGRVDIVVNNAGILRDKSFIGMTQKDWELIQRVHVNGSYSVSKAAWPYMRKQKYGRIIMTSSNSAIYGNFGQANYAAAKLALIGLSNTLAREGVKYNIHANTIVPTAGSRMTLTVFPKELVDALHPEFVMPLTVWLCHESCPDSGGVYEAAAGWFGQLQWYRSTGKILGGGGGLPEPEEVKDNWEEIKNMDGCEHFASSAEVYAKIAEIALGKQEENRNSTEKSNTASGKTNPKLAKKYQFSSHTYDYGPRDTIIYALGVGSESPEDLNVLYENDGNFHVLPTFAVVPGLAAIQTELTEVPGLDVKWEKVLHGEQYLEVYEPLPTRGRVISRAKVADVLDKRTGAAVLVDVETKNEAGEKLAYGQYTIFLRGEGDFKGNRTSPAEKVAQPLPLRSPDAVVEQKTWNNQAVLYRQGSLDYNPLHIDPAFAQASGFKQPILHGLCSLGFAVRNVLKTYAGGDVKKFKAVKVRFSNPVVPGETLVTEMWKHGDTIHFQTKVKETGNVALSLGYVQLKSATRGAGEEVSGSGGKSVNLKSSGVFRELEKRLKAQSGLSEQIQAIYEWVITKDGKEAGKWTVDLKSGPEGAIYEGPPKDGLVPGVTLTLDDEDMVGLVTGKLNPQKAFMAGKLKIKGNMMLTLKLQNLLRDQAKL